MPAFDLEDDNNFNLTYFDECKLESMEIGDKVVGESGNFEVLRYKDEYILFLMHEGLIRKKKLMSKNFKTLKSLISFLKK